MFCEPLKTHKIRVLNPAGDSCGEFGANVQRGKVLVMVPIDKFPSGNDFTIEVSPETRYHVSGGDISRFRGFFLEPDCVEIRLPG